MRHSRFRPVDSIFLRTRFGLDDGTRKGATMELVDDNPSENEIWLQAQLQALLGSRVRHLRVLCRDDGVILRGVAYSFYAKQLAQHSVMEITKLPVLANEIEVC
jgi:hypothetical protein